MSPVRFGHGLEAAILADDAGAVAHALDAGADVNAADAQGVTPLMVAVDQLRPRAVAALLSRGADPNRKAIDGASAVSLAIANYRVAPDLMTVVLRGGGNPDLRTTGDDPVIVRFVNDRNCEFLGRMKALGANLDVETRAHRPLILAAALRSDWDVVWCLIELGARYDYPPGPPVLNLSQNLADRVPSPDSPIYPFKVKVRDFLRAHGKAAPALPGDAAPAR